MNVLTILQKRSKAFYFFLLILGLINSVLNFSVLILVNLVITKRDLPIFPEYDWAVFIVVVCVSFVCSKFFMTYMIRLTNNILLDFELSIFEKLKQTTFEAFEKLGHQRVFTAIGDTKVLGAIPQTFINIFNSTITLICCLVFLFWNSPMGATALVAIMIILLIIYLFRNRSITKDLNLLRDLQNDYFRYLNDWLYGFREIKVSHIRNNNIFNQYIKENRTQTTFLATKTSIKYLNNDLFGSFSWYIVLGMVLYVIPVWFNFEAEQTTMFIITLSYLMGPIAALISLFPVYTKVKISLERLDQFNDSLQVNEPDLPKIIEHSTINESKPFQTIKLLNIEYDYYDKEKNKTFSLGPITVEILKGEVVFITGGNGSGKSTFVNLLTGLYTATKGSVILDNNEVLKKDFPSYIHRLSVIFSDHYLFSENYSNFDLNHNNQELLNYIKLLHLDEIINIDEVNNTISSKLSKGQQKRLAMVYSLLEKKEILMLDEWAAEQDPEFRKYFYHELLPHFKKMGKTVICVTHDDRFFSFADRIIKFDFGQIVSDTRNHKRHEIIA